MQCKHPHTKWVKARAPSNAQCQYILLRLQVIESTWAERARLCFWKWSQNESMASVPSATQNVKGTKVGFVSKSILTFLLCCTLKITGDNKSIVCCHICKKTCFPVTGAIIILVLHINSRTTSGTQTTLLMHFSNSSIKVGEAKSTMTAVLPAVFYNQ